MKSSSQKRVEEYSLWNILLDVALTALAISSTFILVLHLKPTHRGFFCNDNSIRYPYRDSTIHYRVLYICSCAIPIATMVAVELWLAWKDEGRRRHVALLAGCSLPRWVVRLVRRVLLFATGLGCQEAVANLGKITAGRLRPHFLAVCKPDVLCDASNPGVYITDYECTGEQKLLIVIARMSFPSTHASMSFYAAVFAAVYLGKRVRWSEGAVVLKATAQVLLISAAWFTALSRLHDHKHHWEDVTVGGLLGTLIALFWVWRVLRMDADEAQKSGASETTFVFPADTPAPDE